MYGEEVSFEAACDLGWQCMQDEWEFKAAAGFGPEDNDLPQWCREEAVPQNGNMAMGSRRTTPTAPVAAAVVSLPLVTPSYTPRSQLALSITGGTVLLRRPPKMFAEIGTPSGWVAQPAPKAHVDPNSVSGSLSYFRFRSLLAFRSESIRNPPSQTSLTLLSLVITRRASSP